MRPTQAQLLEFLLKRGGKVRNSELLNEFKEFISCSDPVEKRRNRDAFKSYVNNVAVVKQIDDVKYVVVRKKFQDGIRCDGKAAKSEPGDTSRLRIHSIPTFSKRESKTETAANADVLNNNSCFCTNPVTGCFNAGCENSSPKPSINRSQDGDGVTPGTSKPKTEETCLNDGVLSVTNIARIGKTGAVFAVVAIKSPSPIHSQSEKPQNKRGKPNLASLAKSESQQLLPSMKILPQEVFVERSATVRSALSCLSYAGGKQELHGSPRGRRRLSLACCFPSSAQDARVVKQGLEVAGVVPLEPREHDWHVKSAMGRWGQVYSLLLQDFQLAEKKSFISGFTALHWAAKKGNRKMLCKLLDFSRQAGAGLDVNVKSYDGYTPLHIAAIHGRETILSVLVYDYGADCNVRDNSGKKAYHYLPQHVAPEVRWKLGDPQVFRQVAGYKRSNSKQHFSDLNKGFNTFSKLFQPNVAQRKKSKRRLSLHSVNDGLDENRKGI